MGSLLTQIGAIQISDGEEGDPDAATEALTSYSTTGAEDTAEIEAAPPASGRTFMPD
mgnify:CR=1 FL=1